MKLIMYLMTAKYFDSSERALWRRAVFKSKDLSLSFVLRLKKDSRFRYMQKYAILRCFMCKLKPEQITLIANPDIYFDNMLSMCYGFMNGVNMRQMRFILREIIPNYSIASLNTIMDMAVSGASYSELKREAARQDANPICILAYL